MKTDGSLERKSQKKVSAIPRTKYDTDAQAKARAMAALPPNISPNLPYTGPPHSCTTAKVVCRYPKNTGSTPSFFVKYWKINQGGLYNGIEIKYLINTFKCFILLSSCCKSKMQGHIEISVATMFRLPSAKDNRILVRHCETVLWCNIVFCLTVLLTQSESIQLFW